MSGWSVPSGGSGGPGEPGPPGPAPILESGDVVTLAAGFPATATVRLVEGQTYALDLGLPTGVDGDTPAIQGGNVTALAPGAAPTAALRHLGGASYALDLGLPVGHDGLPGGQGNPGNTGPAPTLQAGNVTGLASGAQPTFAVRQVGAGVYALDLGLPAGAAGGAGGKGDTGATPTLQAGNVTALQPGTAPTFALRNLGGAAYAMDLGIPSAKANPTSTTNGGTWTSTFNG